MPAPFLNPSPICVAQILLSVEPTSSHIPLNSYHKPVSLQQGVEGLHSSLPMTPRWDLSGLNLLNCCACCPNHYEFICATALLCSEDTSLVFASGFYIFTTLSSVKVPEPVGKG